jgi:hypothetical protein
MRTATQAWLEGLGPLANCFWAARAFGVDFDDVAVAVGISGYHLRVWWLLRNETSDRPLPAVVEESVLGPGLPRRSHHMVRFDVPTAINGIWEITRDYLAGDLTSSFVGRALELGRQHDGVAREEARVLRAAMLAMQNAPPGFTGNLDIERLYPAADIEPSQTYRLGGRLHHRGDVPLRGGGHRCRDALLPGAQRLCNTALRSHTGPSGPDAGGILRHHVL